MSETRSRVLLVDDHPDTLALMSRLLRRSGFHVRCAATVGEALLTAEQAAAAADPCDLLISDLRLPDGSGLDLIRQLQARYGLRGIAVTGDGDGEDERESLRAGFERHLTKPIRFDDLMAAVKELAN